MRKVAVVILNYNGISFLKQFLPDVVKHSDNAEIVVADNCSTDESVDFVKTHFPNVTLLELSENGGYSKGYNEALQLITAEYYVLLNSDVEVTEGWLNPMIEMMDNDPSIAAAQPKILDYNKKTHFEYAGAGGGFIDVLGYPFCRGRIFQCLEEDLGQYDDTIQVFWATGACLFVRSKAFHEAGRLDSDFFAHMEEIDLCWRLNMAGWKIMYNGKSRVYHVGGGTLERTNPKKTYLNFRNGLAMLYKNYTTKQLIVNLPIRILLDWVAATKFMLFDGWKNGLAVLKADAHFMLNINKMYQKRKSLHNSSKPKYALKFLKSSIVIDHFIRNVRKFNQLKF